MKKTVIIIAILLLLLSAIFVSCGNDVTCPEMLNRVLNSKSITVKCNGDIVFMKDEDTIYWRHVYGNEYEEYYFEKTAGGTAYVYCKEYGSDWVKEPMTRSEYDEYVKMIAESYGIKEYAYTLLTYVYDNFDSVMVLTEDKYVMATTAFDMVKNLTLSNNDSTLSLSCYVYSTYYNAEFFSINSTKLDVPESALRAPVGTISLP